MPPLSRDDALELLKYRHEEWIEFASGPNSWRWLLDSLEGGDRYRHAVYGYEKYFLRFPVSTYDNQPISDLSYYERDQWRWSSRTWSLPRRNLIRHRREYPTPERPEAGGPAEFTSTDDEFELRLARTPIPGFVSEAIGIHLGRIYSREVRREAPDNHPIKDWWRDVDGRGSSIDDWMQSTIAPILSVLGLLDLIFDHPPAPAGEEVRTRADVARLRLGACVAGYILPENLIWWKLLPDGRYAECLVVEGWQALGWPAEPKLIRHWTATDSVLYEAGGEVVSVTPHPFGRVPIVRVIDQRKARCSNVGQSRYEPLAEIQREYYNVSSESVLSNTLQAHPLLSGPEDFVSGTAISTGPSYVLPKKKSSSGDHYEGWEWVEPGSGPADKLRQKLMDLRDEADRMSALIKPAGAAGATQQTVSQSGVSKIMDEAKGNDWLVKQASMLERAEKAMVEFALCVMADGPPKPAGIDAVTVGYPREFNLRSAADLAALAIDFQAIAAGAGDMPFTDGSFIKGLVRLALPGRCDDDYEMMDAEIDEYLAAKQTLKDQQRESMSALAAASTAANTQASPGGTAPTDAAEASADNKMVEQMAMRSLLKTKP